MSITVTAEHEGKTYNGRIVTAKSTRIGQDDHGFVPWVSTDCVDLFGLGFGPRAELLGPFLIDFLDTIGVSTWEKVQGCKFIVLFEGHSARGVSGLTTGKTMVWEQWFAQNGTSWM